MTEVYGKWDTCDQVPASSISLRYEKEFLARSILSSELRGEHCTAGCVMCHTIISAKILSSCPSWQKIKFLQLYLQSPLGSVASACVGMYAQANAKKRTEVDSRIKHLLDSGKEETHK